MTPHEARGPLAPRLVLVTRETEYDGLMARHATRGQAAAFLRHRDQSLDALDAQRHRMQAMLAEIRAAVPKGWRIAAVRRASSRWGRTGWSPTSPSTWTGSR